MRRSKKRSERPGPNGELHMRLVLDNNVAVSGLLWLGPSRYLLESGSLRDARFYTTDDLMESLARVLRRPKFSAHLLKRGLTPKAALDRYARATTIVRAQPVLAPGLRDPDDLIVLACAVAANADMIVTGDEDLLVLAEFRGIPIVRPIDAARALGYPDSPGAPVPTPGPAPSPDECSPGWRFARPCQCTSRSAYPGSRDGSSRSRSCAPCGRSPAYHPMNGTSK